jgi:hypothetical protein
MICYVSDNSVEEALSTDYWTFSTINSVNSFNHRSRCTQTTVHIVHKFYGIQLSLKWWQFDECDVVIANLKVLFTKATRAVCDLRPPGRGNTLYKCRAAAVPSADVVHSGLHLRVLLKPTHCNTFLYGYNGTFPSAGSWLLGQQATPRWLAYSPYAVERRPPLTSAINLIPSMSSIRTVYSV